MTDSMLPTRVALEAEGLLHIRVGRIRYHNAIPFYHRLDQNCRDAGRKIDFQFVDDCPARINEMMLDGALDVAPISSLAYFFNPGLYYLLPDLAISARDFSGSVLLFSKEKIDKLGGKTLAVTNESLSSVTLLKLILKYKFKFENKFVSCDSDPDAMLQKYPAALVIGDDALFYQPKNFIYKYDLSELWWNWTGKPFCFAAWAVRKVFADQYPSEVTWLCDQIRKTRDRNLADIENLLKESNGLQFTDERFSKLFGYLFNLNYSFESPMQEGLELYYRLAERMGVGARPKELEFFNPEC